MAKTSTDNQSDPIAKLKAFCQQRKNGYERLYASGQIAQMFGVGGGAYADVLHHIDGGAITTLDDIRKLLIDWNEKGIKSPTIEDIRAFVNGGRGYLPEDPLDLAAFFAAERAKAIKAEMESRKQHAIEMKKAEEEKIRAEKAAKRAALAEELGIDKSALEKLAATKS